MAVENKYTDANISGNRITSLLRGINGQGSPVRAMFATFEVAAADSDTSVYRVFKDVPPDLIILEALVACDAITAGTAWEFGIYAPDLGAVIDSDALSGGTDMDLSSALATFVGTTPKNALAGIVIEDFGKRVFEHAGHTVITKLKSYDLALTAVTVGSAAGTVSVRMLVCQG